VRERERERKKEARILLSLLHSSSPSCHFSAAAAEGLLCFAAERRCNNEQKHSWFAIISLESFPFVLRPVKVSLDIIVLPWR
jgi:hypothetical protein